MKRRRKTLIENHKKYMEKCKKRNFYISFGYQNSKIESGSAETIISLNRPIMDIVYAKQSIVKLGFKSPVIKTCFEVMNSNFDDCFVVSKLS